MKKLLMMLLLSSVSLALHAMSRERPRIYDGRLGKTMQLHKLAAAGEEEVVFHLLVQEGECPNYPDEYGLSPLHIAIQHDQTLIAAYLMQYGGDINARDNTLRTPLHEAVYYERHDVVEALLQIRWIDINAQDGWGQTPIHEASDLDDPTMFGMLVKAGAACNVVDTNGFTPLHRAANFGCLEIVTYLVICTDLDINQQDNTGWTPLHWAVMGGDLEIIEVLLRYGADRSITNQQGQTPRQLALDFCFDEEAAALFEQIKEPDRIEGREITGDIYSNVASVGLIR
ncbi:MAG: ankyrin repeat domain-containing protein [Epsilonproteobacteria bacterium]|nr:ankyrin repeat domain-containing protein [Campylobacterota bacterium]